MCAAYCIYSKTDGRAYVLIQMYHELQQQNLVRHSRCHHLFVTSKIDMMCGVMLTISYKNKIQNKAC